MPMPQDKGDRSLCLAICWTQHQAGIGEKAEIHSLCRTYVGVAPGLLHPLDANAMVSTRSKRLCCPPQGQKAQRTQPDSFENSFNSNGAMYTSRQLHTPRISCVFGFARSNT